MKNENYRNLGIIGEWASQARKHARDPQAFIQVNVPKAVRRQDPELAQAMDNALTQLNDAIAANGGRYLKPDTYNAIIATVETMAR